MINVSTNGNGRSQSTTLKTYFFPKMIYNRHIMWSNAFFTDLRLQLTITRQSDSCQMTFTVQRLPGSKNFTRCRRKYFRFFTVGKAEQRQWKWLSLIHSFGVENGKFSSNFSALEWSFSLLWIILWMPKYSTLLHKNRISLVKSRWLFIFPAIFSFVPHRIAFASLKLHFV